jgi:Synergist-CTERM protein sorting domain-containing protein
MSGAFVVLHARPEGEPLSGASSGGCSGGYLPGMLLLVLPWFLLKP